MKKPNPNLRSFVLLTLLLFVQSFAEAANVTLNVFQSDGTTPIAGVSTFYGVAVTVPFGTTNGSGSVTQNIPAGAYHFKVAKGGSSFSLNANIVNDTVINFYTSKATINVRSAANAPLSGAIINIAGSSTYTAGATASNGSLVLELFPGQFGVTAGYNGTVKTTTHSLAGTGLTAGAATGISFYTTEVVSTVMSSASSPLQGAVVKYQSGYASYAAGTTGVNGQASAQLFPGTFVFEATYRGSVKATSVLVTGDGLSAGSSTPVNYYTTSVTSIVKSCDNVVISGVTLSYIANAAHYNIGATAGNGTVNNEVFPGSYKYRAIYKGTERYEDVIISGDGLTPSATSPVAFTPTAVNLGNAGITYKVGYFSLPANGTVYMFPGNYDFTFQGEYTLNLAVSGCSKVLAVNVLVLKDHNGNPLPGGTARGGYGANFSTFHVPNGPTNNDGVIFDVRNPSANTTMSYEMRYNNTTKVLTQDVASNNVFQFQTNQLTLRLETCNGLPLSGGTARYGHGATYGSFYLPGAPTDANGNMSAEVFPGTYSFEMNYHATSEVKSSEVIPDANHTLTWKTTNVVVNWPNQVAYGGGTGDATLFTKSGTEMLPGTINFNFRTPGNNRSAVAISGCSMAITPGVITLKSSTNAPISGGTVELYQGGWSEYGTTNSEGKLIVIGKNPSSVRMILGGGGQTLHGINFAVNSFVNFQTIPVKMELKDANGAYTLEGNTLEYFAGSWKQFGSGATTNSMETMEMLPISYSFRLTYLGKSQQISNQDVSVNPVVSYQTSVVNIKLMNELNVPIAGGLASYYANGWYNIGNTAVGTGVTSLEMLPGSYSFRMVHAGKAKQKDNVVISNPGPNSVDFIYNASNNNWARYTTSNDPAKAVLFEAYPNPASSQITLKFNSEKVSKSSVKITDIAGKLILANEFDVNEGPNSVKLNLATLPNGTYVLVFDNGEIQEIKKIVVHH